MAPLLRSMLSSYTVRSRASRTEREGTGTGAPVFLFQKKLCVRGVVVVDLCVVSVLCVVQPCFLIFVFLFVVVALPVNNICVFLYICVRARVEGARSRALSYSL